MVADVILNIMANTVTEETNAINMDLQISQFPIL
jgi:hypothetical protein